MFDAEQTELDAPATIKKQGLLQSAVEQGSHLALQTGDQKNA